MLEFGAKKGLFIETAPIEKMGHLEMPEIHLAHWTELGVFKHPKGNGNGG